MYCFHYCALTNRILRDYMKVENAQDYRAAVIPISHEYTLKKKAVFHMNPVRTVPKRPSGNNREKDECIQRSSVECVYL